MKKIFKLLKEDCRGILGLIVAGIVVIGGLAIAYAGPGIDLKLREKRADAQKIENIGNEFLSNTDPNKLYEKTKEILDPNKDEELSFINKANYEDFGKAHQKSFKTLEEAKDFYRSFYLNNKTLEKKAVDYFDKITFYMMSGKWEREPTPPVKLVDVENFEKNKTKLQQEMAEREKEFAYKLTEIKSSEEKIKELEEKLKVEISEEQKALLKSEIAESILAADFAMEEDKALEEKEKMGVQNYLIEQIKSELEKRNILADEKTVFAREQYFKKITWINEIEKVSPRPEWLDDEIKLVQEQKKWLDENDPLIKFDELVTWLTTSGSEITDEVTPESGEDTNTSSTPDTTVTTTTKTTDTSTTALETVTQPTETASIVKLTLYGEVVTLLGNRFPLMMNINLETGEVTGTFSFSGSGPAVIWKTDENDNKISGTEKQVVADLENNGSIDGGIDITNYIISGDFSDVGYIYYEGSTITVTDSGSVLGSLDENNQASGTFSNGWIWEVR